MSLGANSETGDKGWDTYWKVANSNSNWYGLIAGIYRRWIIRRTLNFWISKSFAVNSVLLHAGCGSGAVDVDLHHDYSVIALDYSAGALNAYRSLHDERGILTHASFFEIPLRNESVDGVFNLGVMEHLKDDEVSSSLSEFVRVLKPGGKVVLFWPPQWGLSVMALRLISMLLSVIKKNKVVLHPPEINLFRSRKLCSEIFLRNGLVLKDCKFGIRDLFTHQIVVGIKK